jgi:hypothetical protein
MVLLAASELKGVTIMRLAFTRLNAALTAMSFALGIAAVPLSMTYNQDGLHVGLAKAFAKHGADDPAGDDHGGRRGAGGNDDGPNHH